MTVLPPKNLKRVKLKQVLLTYIYFFYKMTILPLKTQNAGQTKKGTPLYLFFYKMTVLPPKSQQVGQTKNVLLQNDI